MFSVLKQLSPCLLGWPPLLPHLPRDSRRTITTVPHRSFIQARELQYEYNPPNKYNTTSPTVSGSYFLITGKNERAEDIVIYRIVTITQMFHYYFLHVGQIFESVNLLEIPTMCWYVLLFCLVFLFFVLQQGKGGDWSDNRHRFNNFDTF